MNIFKTALIGRSQENAKFTENTNDLMLNGTRNFTTCYYMTQHTTRM
ncbi:MAG: hypothetical protein PVG30_09000 [Gammaproteobacteria bacterium]